MAVFVNFTVEAESQDVISSIQQRFEGFTARIVGIQVAMQHSCAIEKNDVWYYLAAPSGLMHNGGGYVDALNTEFAHDELREAFYSRLHGQTGFRRAWFNTEAFDMLGDPAEYDRCDLPHLILRKSLAEEKGLRGRCIPFSDGFLRVNGDGE